LSTARRVCAASGQGDARAAANFKEIVEGLESTNESVISHRLNDGLRVLTAVSVILLSRSRWWRASSA
jgi:hypothetical protein